MVVSCQFWKEAGWATEPVWTLERKEKYPVLSGIEPGSSSSQSVPSLLQQSLRMGTETPETDFREVLLRLLKQLVAV